MFSGQIALPSTRVDARPTDPSVSSSGRSLQTLRIYPFASHCALSVGAAFAAESVARFLKDEALT